MHWPDQANAGSTFVVGTCTSSADVSSPGRSHAALTRHWKLKRENGTRKELESSGKTVEKMLKPRTRREKPQGKKWQPTDDRGTWSNEVD